MEAANGRFANRVFAGAILVSDNQSWIGTGNRGSTGVMTAWDSFVRNQRKLAGRGVDPKLVCIDIQPYRTTQTVQRADIMNIGGFSDTVFNVVSTFLSDNRQRLVEEVEAMTI